MIQANELRIMNWVFSPIQKTNCKIVALRSGYQNPPIVDNNGNGEPESSFSSCDCLEPIPLDESWLRRAGFAPGLLESTREGNGYHKNIRLIGFFDEVIEWGGDLGGAELIPLNIILEDNKAYCGLEEFNIACIKYVHQLQNLFFALTGTELEFSDK